ncbi:MAG: zinc ribbon domain-containing protein [Rhodoferax sp.]|nr:zinc ribbon domain-containing protein [Rhodoferax sp.]
MPIYEYACSACGHKFEALVRSGTQPQCPACQSPELDKLLSVFATTTTQAAPTMPSPCQSCSHANGPAGCGMN